MARRFRFRSRRAVPRQPLSRSSTYSLIGLGLIALATVVLVAVAFLSRPAASTETLPEPTAVSEPSTPVPSQTPPPAPEEAPDDAGDASTDASTAAVPTRWLAVNPSSGTVLRAQTGSCDAPLDEPGLEVSFDEGDTWSTSNLSRLDAAELRHLELNEAVAQLVYLDDECTPRAANSFSDGAEWAPSEEPPSTWNLVSPGEPAAITPSGEVELPCPAVALSSAGERGVALCADATVTSSTDAGASWSAPVEVAGAVAVGVADDVFLAVSANEPGCAGVVVSPVDDAGTGDPGQCLEVDVEPGAVAVAGAAGTWYVWAGESLLRSSDGGATWA